MNNQQAIKKALSLVGQGYIYGAKGQKCSPAFRQQQAEQYPEYAEYILGIGAKWDGVPVWDCAQLTRAVAKAGGETLVSGATSQWNKTEWEMTGEIDSAPIGEALFLFRRKTGSKTTMQHVGFALGDGTVVHARGTEYGVVRQPVEDYPWTHWGVMNEDAGALPPHQSPAATASPQGEANEQEGSTDMLYPATAKAADSGSINLRSGPSKAAGRIDRVPSGSTIHVLEEGTDWHRVRYEGKEGYMMAQYIHRQTDESTDTVSIILPKDAARSLKAALEKINL